MINEFIDYDLSPSMAWGKTYNDSFDYGTWVIEYGTNAWIGNDYIEFCWWARARLISDRDFPIYIHQRYSHNPRELMQELYSDMRCALQR